MTGKPNRAERIIQFLEARYPGWVPAIELEPVGGRLGWRTAVSIARRMLREREGRWEKADDPLPNRLQYRYLHALDCPVWQAWTTDTTCLSCTLERITISYYRLKKRGESSQTEEKHDERSLALADALPHRDGQDLRDKRTETASHDLNEWSLR